MFIHLNEHIVTKRLEGETVARVTPEHVDARRTAILDAARHIFTKKGIASATMQEIASEAGLSAGAIYRYFPSKDDLLRAFYEQCLVTGPAETIQEGVDAATSPRERLRGAAQAARAHWEEDEGRAIIGELETMLVAARQPEVIGSELKTARQYVHQAIERTIREAQAAGEIDPALDARALAITLFASVYGIGILSLEHDEAEVDTMYRTLQEMVDRLAPRPERP
jgi:AcrR family transcriptional regulator